MIAKDFIRAVAKDEGDIIQSLLDMLQEAKASYCVVGGVAGNAYVEPVGSLDLDVVVVAADTEKICKKAEEKGFKVERFPYSINLSAPKSDLRIQLQTDERYQDFIRLAVSKKVLGYRMRVARLEDVLQGKVWAYLDESRRKSK